MDAHTGVSVLLLPLIRPVNEKIGKQEKLQLSVLACLCDFFPTASVAFYSTCESRGPNCHQLNNMCTLKSISRDQHHSKQKDMRQVLHPHEARDVNANFNKIINYIFNQIYFNHKCINDA